MLAMVPIANPAAFAEACIPLLANEDAWRAARDAGIARVEKYYDEKDMLERYHTIYKEKIAHAMTDAETAELKQASGGR